ncbi:MAG: 3-deoxy-7-phosphoheptulonate synthase [Spirochaetes bacterium GWF1_51_8]|nr:MAG: 3-deoxy-7-phosphoheptulonate synthase [Spirochaetes bacterium GWF1_51_8]
MALLEWKKDGWRNFPAAQQPEYPDGNLFKQALIEVEKLPPLVFSGEVEKLKSEIAEAGAGKRFILHGGDCAERFIDCNSAAIVNKIKILLQMSVLLTHGLHHSVVRIGRIAGQYAKPRSSPTETIGGVVLQSYKGDNVNGIEPDVALRVPDPGRMVKSYFYSSATLNFVRAMIDGGYADLHHPYTWNLYNIEKSPRWNEYKKRVDSLLDAIRFMETFGGLNSESLGRIDFFTSHEGLLLGYEEAMTRKSPLNGKYYNLGAHMLWIGERTRQLDGAHVEYFRGIGNPVGIKIGPKIAPEELTDLVAKLNPSDEPGRITLITRMGVEKVDTSLPPLISAVKKAGQAVTWSCDPMHGNTITVGEGDLARKTRDFNSILEELRRAFAIHTSAGSTLAGVHFEMTGDDVTECIGGSQELTHLDLQKNYETYVDPRLNYHQALEMAFLIISVLKDS